MPTILVIDDDESIRRSIRKFLERVNYLVLEAENGADALAVLDEHEVDLVITDIFMPVQDGFEIISEIRGKHRNLKIIAISGGGIGADDSVLPLAVKLGADYYLHKPFIAREIIGTVERILEDDPDPQATAD